MNKPPLATNMHLCCRDANHKHLYLLANAGAKRGVAEVEERSPHLRFCEWESWRNLEEASVTDGGGGGISSSLAPAHLCSPPLHTQVCFRLQRALEKDSGGCTGGTDVSLSLRRVLGHAHVHGRQMGDRGGSLPGRCRVCVMP